MLEMIGVIVLAWVLAGIGIVVAYNIVKTAMRY